MADLYRASIDVIEAGQDPSGAFFASPDFGAYRYAWLRDGCFVAYGADRAGRHDLAERFLRWLDRTLRRYEERVDRLVDKASRGETIEQHEWLHCRYTPEGLEGTEPWGSFQLDGYGTYLWALSEHVRITGRPDILAECQPTIDLTLRYLLTFWERPNFDCWEEHGEHLHAATLAAIYGGLQAINHHRQDPTIAQVAEQIRAYVRQSFVHNGRLTKFADGRSIDANLLWVSTPFRLLEPTDPVMVDTVAEMERTLVQGGVHRYPEDKYYGGGQWLLLTAWLGWYYSEVGRQDRARELLAWVESKATPAGHLPEQVADRVNDPAMVQPWIDRWGPVATPLLWSHAMYLVLRAELNR